MGCHNSISNKNRLTNDLQLNKQRLFDDIKALEIKKLSVSFSKVPSRSRTGSVSPIEHEFCIHSMLNRSEQTRSQPTLGWGEKILDTKAKPDWSHGPEQSTPNPR